MKVKMNHQTVQRPWSRWRTTCGVCSYADNPKREDHIPTPFHRQFKQPMEMLSNIIRTQYRRARQKTKIIKTR